VTEPLEYVTHEGSGRVHLTRSFFGRTLCGVRISDVGWTLGDETLCGIAATCVTCQSRNHAGAQQTARRLATPDKEWT
jgi:hypothetical protein